MEGLTIHEQLENLQVLVTKYEEELRNLPTKNTSIEITKKRQELERQINDTRKF